MGKAVVSYQGADLEAWDEDGQWTVRLGTLEATSRYLDLALSEVVDDAEDAHQLAARLVAELAHAPETDEMLEQAAAA